MSSLNHPFIERKLKQLWKFYKEHKSDRVTLAEKQWKSDFGDSTKRLEYDLNEKSIVLDFGGYVGNFSHQLVSMYDPYIFIFEPVKEFYNILKRNFANNKKVKIFDLAISNKNKKQTISVSGAKSSTYMKESDEKQIIKEKDIKEFIEENNLKKIDLMKINIEGGEYEVLERLIETGLVKRIKDIQVQFHKISKNSVKRRKNIINKLKQTHERTYSYYFVWENWRLKKL